MRVKRGVAAHKKHVKIRRATTGMTKSNRSSMKRGKQALTKALKEDFGMKLVHGKLGGGTDRVGGMEYLLELDLNDKRLSGIYGND